MSDPVVGGSRCGRCIGGYRGMVPSGGTNRVCLILWLRLRPVAPLILSSTMYTTISVLVIVGFHVFRPRMANLA